MASESAITPNTPPVPGLVPAVPSGATPERGNDPAWPWLVGLLLLLTFMTALVPIRNSDFLQHLALGRSVAGGQLPLGTDRLTYPGEVVVSANSSWLFDLTVYLLYAVGGAVAVLVVKAMLTVLIVELQLRAANLPKSPAAPLVGCVLLGLVVLGPYLLVQSRFASLVCLAFTVYLLARARCERPPPVWALPVVCLIWGNCDVWFFLGPLCVALAYVGLHIEDRMQPEREKLAGRLFVPMVASLVAALLNPGLLAMRWDLPPELGVNACLPFVEGLPGYTHLSASPLAGGYFLTTTGWNPSGLGYFVLLTAALGSFPLLGHRMAWSGLLVVAVLAFLSLYRVVAIPFLAIAAAPWLARNLLEMLEIQSATSPGQKSSGGLLAGTLIVVVTIATIPGWLHSYPFSQHRIGFGHETDAGLREMAEKTAELGAWYREKTGQPSPVWLATSPTAAHYISWYAPSERTYLDQRLLLSAGAARDYQLAIQAPFHRLNETEALYQGKPRSGEDRYAGIRERGVRWLAFHQPDLLGGLQAAKTLGQGATIEEFARRVPVALPMLRLAADRLAGDWAVLQVRGATSLYGLRLPANPGDRLDPVFNEKSERFREVAFGENALKAPLDPLMQDVEPHNWVLALWSPEPPPNAEVQEAAQYFLLFEATQRPTAISKQFEWESLRLAGQVAAASRLGVGPSWQQTALGAVLQSAQIPLQLYMSDQDRGSIASIYLALRTARRSLANNPYDARAHLLVARAYFYLVNNTREGYRSQNFELLAQLRRYQIVTAARAAVRLDPELEEAHVILSNVYGELRFLDLHLNHRMIAHNLNLQAGPYPNEQPEDAKKRWGEQEKQLEELRKHVESLRKTFTVKTNGMKGLDRAAAAVLQQPDGNRYGLATTALEILRQLSPEEIREPVGGEKLGSRLRMEMELLHGNISPVVEVMAGTDAPKEFTVHPGLGVPAFLWFRLCLGACSGNYQIADDAIETLLEVAAEGAKPGAANEGISFFTSFLGQLAARVQVPPPPQTFALPGLGEPLFVADNLGRRYLSLRGAEGGLLTLRGCLALESGQTEKAKANFEKTIELAEKAQIFFAAAGIARVNLELFKKQ